MASIGAVLAPLTRERKVAAPEVARDKAWFSNLYAESVDSVYRYAQVLVRDCDRAEDVTADVFMRAWRGRSGLRSDANALSWLLSITHNSSMSHLRATRPTADIDAVAEPEDETADPEAALFAEADAMRVRDAIGRLTPEQQQVVFLRFFEGLSHEEVAARLGGKANAIRALQFRALVRLRKLLQEEPDACSA